MAIHAKENQFISSAANGRDHVQIRYVKDAWQTRRALLHVVLLHLHVRLHQLCCVCIRIHLKCPVRWHAEYEAPLLPDAPELKYPGHIGDGDYVGRPHKHIQETGRANRSAHIVITRYVPRPNEQPFSECDLYSVTC